MNADITIRTNNTNHMINCVVVRDDRWYRAKDVALALGYKNTKQAVIVNVIIDNTKTEGAQATS